jgi:hypothetical protein
MLGLGTAPRCAAVWRAVGLPLAGCASLKTVKETPAGQAARDGIVYFMPTKAFRFTVMLDKDGVRTATVAPTDAIPDLTKRYVLQYNRSLAGTNKVNIGVSAKGLLSVSTAETISGADTLAQAIGTLAGDMHAFGLSGGRASTASVPTGCQAGQTYNLIVEPRTTFWADLCGFRLEGALYAAPANPVISSKRADQTGAQAGIYYRRELPYLLTVTDTENGSRNQVLAYSPSQSEISYIPVTQGFFGGSKATITLSEGSVTNLEQSSDGELPGLLKFPATILTSYFAAVGAVFGSFSSNASAQGTELNSQMALTLVQLKNQACQAAIVANDPESKKDAELTTAIANIKAACGTGS